MLERGKGTISEELEMLIVCEKMGWDFYTYEKQPTWFVKLLTFKFNIENEYQNRTIKKYARQTKATNSFRGR